MCTSVFETMDGPGILIFVSYIPFTEMLVTYACMSGPKVGTHTEILKPLNILNLSQICTLANWRPSLRSASQIDRSQLRIAPVFNYWRGQKREPVSTVCACANFRHSVTHRRHSVILLTSRIAWAGCMLFWCGSFFWFCQRWLFRKCCVDFAMSLCLLNVYFLWSPVNRSGQKR